MKMDINTINVATIIETIAAGLIIALIVGIGRWLTQKINKKFYLPIKTSVESSVLYGYHEGSYAVISSLNQGKRLNSKTIVHALATRQSSYLCPIPFVIRFTNTSDKKNPREFYVNEVEIVFKNHQQSNEYLHDKVLVHALHGVHAGGRGVEGNFHIHFRYSDNLRIPIIRLSAMEDNASPRNMKVMADSFSEIGFWLIPLETGRYTFDVFVDLKAQGHTHRVKAAQNISILYIKDFSWVTDEITVESDWKNPRRTGQPIDDQYHRMIALDWSEFSQKQRDEVRGIPLINTHARVVGEIREDAR